MQVSGRLISGSNGLKLGCEKIEATWKRELLKPNMTLGNLPLISLTKFLDKYLGIPQKSPTVIIYTIRRYSFKHYFKVKYGQDKYVKYIKCKIWPR